MKATDTNSIESALKQAGISKAKELAALATSSVRISATKTDMKTLKVGASHFGGAPDVPPGFLWPKHEQRPLTFLGQIDLADVASSALPDQGWLLFFYDVREQPWGFDPKDTGSATVMFVKAKRSELVRSTHPPIDQHAGPFVTSKLTFSTGMNLPDAWDSVVKAAGLEIPSKHQDAYKAVAASLAGIEKDALCSTPYHHILGHPQPIQGDMRGECELVTNGIYTGDPIGYNSPRAKALLTGAAAQWRLLLQIDTDDKGPGWMWGDCGRLYFWIRNKDLEARVFDRPWVILQCE